jgi:hypothetical protein
MGLGAKTIVVPGNFPIGCSPGYLAKFRANDTAQYDSRGCLRWANNLAALHNSALKAELARLSLQHPGVAVLYADYYAAAMTLIADRRKHGFGGDPLVSCCGGGGPYNVDLAALCRPRRAATRTWRCRGTGSTTRTSSSRTPCCGRRAATTGTN